MNPIRRAVLLQNQLVKVALRANRDIQQDARHADHLLDGETMIAATIIACNISIDRQRLAVAEYQLHVASQRDIAFDGGIVFYDIVPAAQVTSTSDDSTTV